jgi:FixJ family two-component response regulator
VVSAPLICVVEDDQSLLDAMVGLVQSVGYLAEGYSSAEAFFDAGPPRSACVITDIQMPGLSGIELKHRLVAEGRTTPVIMVTARSEPGLKAQALASGAVCLLRKPFSADALIGCLAKALHDLSP